ncbi:MAG: hypothetical protein QHG99_08475 [Methanomicrobiales archaeon]|nr:hypothetical protein [Methanomicrobiales archaeon]
MEDIRFRVVSTLALSAAAFASLHGALIALLWLAIIDRGRRAFLRPKILFTSGILLALISILIAAGGGDGLSYAIRILAVLLVAAWAYGEYRGGELLDLFVWLFGEKAGFELGMMAEMGMTAVYELERDVERIGASFKLKGAGRSIPKMSGMGLSILHSQLARAEEQAIILAIRGYRRGGTHCPEFSASRIEAIAMLFALIALISAIIPPVNYLYF